MLNINKVNKELKRIGYKSELVRGEAYFYFQGDEADHFETQGVYVPRINDLSLEGWIYEFEQKVLAAAKDRPDTSLFAAVKLFTQVNRHNAILVLAERYKDALIQE